MKHFAHRVCLLLILLLGLPALLSLSGCDRLHRGPAHNYVYVSVRQTFLRDRVAAVSNRVADVSNGERLQVLEHDRRFFKVKTEKGAVGWIEEHYVIDQAMHDQFAALQTQHAQDPVVATGVLEDDSYLHVAPGRRTQHYYLLPENDKLQLLVRASVPKPVIPGMPLALAEKVSTKDGKEGGEAAPPPVPLEDYWLVRDSQGRTGWVRARALEVDVPDPIGTLAESERMVGAYLLRTVSDPESSFPNGQAPEYLAVLAPYKDGLPYDFDQIRIFTWNTRKHRYETAYRERDLEGFFPVKVTSGVFNKQTEPVFSFRVSDKPGLALNAATGELNPGPTVEESFRLEGALVRRIGPDTDSAKAAAAQPEAARRPERRRHRRERR